MKSIQDKGNLLATLSDGWQLCPIAHKDIKKMPVITRSSDLAEAGLDIINAIVPGSIELDLYRAGVIDNPYFGTNTLNMQKLEDLHMFYFTTFDLPSEINGELFLRFEGIDTFADIFLNGEKLGSADNMLIPHEFSLEDASLCETGNELMLHIRPAMIETRKFELPPSVNSLRYISGALYARKAPHMYGWDIMPRMVSGGIWKPVTLRAKQPERITDFYAYTQQISENHADCALWFSVETESAFAAAKEIRIYGSCGDSSFDKRVRLEHTSGTIRFTIDNPKLWYPANAGEPNLYDTVIELYDRRGDVPLDTRTFRFGVRTVELIRTSVTDDAGSGEFKFNVNGKDIFLMGTNWVPVDAIHANDESRLPGILPMLRDIGVNCVRCWGGNVYESDTFFDYCDENGILVWQDFAMGCCLYPTDKIFEDMLRPEIEQVVRRLRNHACLGLWAGDNECDTAYAGGWSGMRRDPNQNTITRKLIPEILQLHDHVRPYLPSSPYVDEEAYRTGAPTPEDHLWGPRDYFKGEYYKNAAAHFASETGYHGCPSPASLRRFLPEDQLWPWRTEGTDHANKAWLTHASCMEADPDSPYAYRIPLMAAQVKTLFGEEPEDLDMFAAASQISQGEAMKYFIERFRISKWRRTGIIWWNLIDGWPQISDAVVDYYGTKKLAYHYIKRSQQPFALMFDEPDGDTMKLFAVNDTPTPVEFSFTVRDAVSGQIFSEAKALCDGDTSTPVWLMDIDKDEQRFYIMEWETADGVKGMNHYVSGMPGLDYEMYMEGMRSTGFINEFQGFM